jgi:hypothetical protein
MLARLLGAVICDGAYLCFELACLYRLTPFGVFGQQDLGVDEMAQQLHWSVPRRSCNFCLAYSLPCTGLSHVAFKANRSVGF